MTINEQEKIKMVYLAPLSFYLVAEHGQVVVG